MVTGLSDADRARIAAAVAEAEARTGVELRLVLAHSSSHYGAFALIYPGLLALLVGGGVAAVEPALRAWILFTVQAALFLAGVALMQHPALRRALAPPSVRHKAAWRHARLHYASIGLKQPHTKSAVLLFCSQAERTVEILADDAIAEKLPESVWQAVVAAFRRDMAAGRIADAFVTAAASCADILAPAFPPVAGKANEVPDDLVEI